MANTTLIDMVNNAVNILRDDMKQGFEKIDKKIDTLVSKESCQNNRSTCARQTETQREEMSIKRITAIGGVITGTIAASTTFIVTILKIFY